MSSLSCVRGLVRGFFLGALEITISGGSCRPCVGHSSE